MNLPKVETDGRDQTLILCVVFCLLAVGTGGFAVWVIFTGPLFLLFPLLAMLFLSGYGAREVLVESRGDCYYCYQPVQGCQERMLITWSENTKYSGLPANAKICMHTACHKAAPPEQRFRFPVPEFKDIEI